jgi:hypothetical protein
MTPQVSTHRDVPGGEANGRKKRRRKEGVETERVAGRRKKKKKKKKKKDSLKVVGIMTRWISKSEAKVGTVGECVHYCVGNVA